MRTTHTFGIQFIIRPNKKDRSKGIIYARITVESKRIEILLKKTMSIEFWNIAKGKAKGSSPEIKSLNSYLEQVHAKLTECNSLVLIKVKNYNLIAVCFVNL